MSTRIGRTAGVVASVGTAALVGAVWCWNYRLPGPGIALFAAASAVGVLALAWGSAPLVRRVCPRRAGLGLAESTYLLAAVLPAAAALPEFVERAPHVELALLALGIPLLALAAFALARLGPIAALGAAAAATIWVVSISPQRDDVLAPMPTVTDVVAQSAVVRRVAVLGIDSADWHVIDPLLAAGELPNLQRLIERGASGVLRSIEPTYSPVVWTSIFTGMTPEKHGIIGWYAAHSANRKVPTLWRLLDVAGMSSIVVNVPGTWPPKRSRGIQLSGFPLPTVLRPPSGHNPQVVGRVFAAADRPGSLVPTIVLPLRGSIAEGNALIGEAEVPPRTRLRHFVIDTLDGKRLLPERRVHVAVRFEVAIEGKRRIEIAGNVAELATGEWSPWLRTDVFGQPTQFRVRALASGAFYCTPFFQDPERPSFPIASDAALARRAFGGEMYVAEGAGWRMAADRDLRDTLVEHLRDVELQHLGAARRLADEIPDWKLFVHVFTLLDRTSHAFWRFHDPGSYPPIDADEARESRDRVDDAYRWVDVRIGQLVAQLGDDTTIFVLSDHGAAPDPTGPWGAHRIEGVWIAAGPGIRPTAERSELSVLDVTPTLLAAFGLPEASDMDGVARAEILAGELERREIASYEVDHEAGTMKGIDSTTENQLRSLGYIR